MTQSALLSPDVLETVWSRWHEAEYGYPMSQRYRTLHRSNIKAREFESWLLEQGAEVQQINKERRLRFYNEQHATLFLLRWS